MRDPYGPNLDKSVELSTRMGQPMLVDGDRIPDYHVKPLAEYFIPEVRKMEKDLAVARERIAALEADKKRLDNLEKRVLEGNLGHIRSDDHGFLYASNYGHKTLRAALDGYDDAAIVEGAKDGK